MLKVKGCALCPAPIPGMRAVVGLRAIHRHLGAQERSPWGPGLDFLRFRIWGALDQHMCFFHAYFQSVLMIWGFDSGGPRLQNQLFRARCDAKTNFAHLLGFCCFQRHFIVFLHGLGPKFDDFWCFGDRLEM